MANTYNSNPIVLNTAMAQGWKSLQTLNTASLPSTRQQLSGAVLAQPGIQVVNIVWTGFTAAGHTFAIVDPNDGTQLFNGQAGTTLIDQQYIWDNSVKWRDFKLSQISSGTLLIYYRI